MKLRRFNESSSYKNEKISYNEFIKTIRKVFKFFTEKEIKAIIEYFFQYSNIENMVLYNNDECGGKEIKCIINNNIDYIKKSLKNTSKDNLNLINKSIEDIISKINK